MASSTEYGQVDRYSFCVRVLPDQLSELRARMLQDLQQWRLGPLPSLPKLHGVGKLEVLVPKASDPRQRSNT